MPKYIGLVLAALLCNACDSTRDFERLRYDSDELTMRESATYISLSGGACLGTCPDYGIYLLDDGTVHFQGRSRTVVRGIVTQRVRRTNFQRLKRYLEESHAFESGDEGNCLTDFPTFNLVMVDATGKRQAFLDTGCGGERRDMIWEIVDTVARLTDTTPMIR